MEPSTGPCLLEIHLWLSDLSWQPYTGLLYLSTFHIPALCWPLLTCPLPHCPHHHTLPLWLSPSVSSRRPWLWSTMERKGCSCSLQIEALQQDLLQVMSKCKGATHTYWEFLSHRPMVIWGLWCQPHSVSSYFSHYVIFWNKVRWYGSQGCCNNIPQTGCLNRNSFSRNLRS